MKKYDLLSGIILFIFGASMFLWSFKYPFGEIQSPGASFLPRLASLVLIVLSVIIVVRALRKSDGSSREAFLQDPKPRNEY